MQKKHAHNHRFAWLKPVEKRNHDNGPWVLVENQTQRYLPENYPDSVRVTINGMLDRMASVMTESILGGLPGQEQCWVSDCNRFEIKWHRQKNDNSRLFVQQPSDYFARIELLIDGLTVLAYQEPVWPHLQHIRGAVVDRLYIPGDCIDILDTYSLEQVCSGCHGDSANETHILDETFDDTQAA